MPDTALKQDESAAFRILSLCTRDDEHGKYGERGSNLGVSDGAHSRETIFTKDHYWNGLTVSSVANERLIY